MDYYDTLDVPQNATQEQIKSHYRILVQLFHPDRLQHVNAQVREYAEERLKRINVAYSTLSDPLKRAKYDDDHDIITSVPAAKKRRRKKAAEAEPEPAYARYAYYDDDDDDIEERLRQENERRRREEAEYRNRQTQDAEAMRQRDAADRARRAAEANLPRVQMESDWLVLHLAPDVSTTLLRVPDGEFRMGSDLALDPDAREDEMPQHTVQLTEYFISKYPITNYQYQIFKDATEPRKFGESGRSGRWQCPPGKELHPVVNISWDEATAFCMWLTQETGVIFRLPTEAEWEKAARNSDGRIYPWGNEWDESKANTEEKYQGTTAVGQFSPLGDSPYGVSDLAGNVWEWCADRYDKEEYMGRKKVTRNPFGPEEGEGVVVRGGAFDKTAKHARCAYRNWYYPFNRRRDVGFRVVAEPF
jgi:formylglycine-generating enzyme required for sulfatase activity